MIPWGEDWVGAREPECSLFNVCPCLPLSSPAHKIRGPCSLRRLPVLALRRFSVTGLTRKPSRFPLPFQNRTTESSHFFCCPAPWWQLCQMTGLGF